MTSASASSAAMRQSDAAQSIRDGGRRGRERPRDGPPVDFRDKYGWK